MTASKTISCFIVGEGSLVVQCALALLERGHTIRGIVTDEPTLQEWAAGQDIETQNASSDLVSWMSAKPFDYLFSIVNLRILPDAVIGLPQVMAVNFHDGPLPRFAGINATSWALIERAERYGVSWHEMTSGADKGRLLAQRLFDVAAGETALSLNARCFDAGIVSFAELADAIGADSLELVEQDFSERTYFGKYQRPPHASVIRFDQTAAEVAAFVAAHDYGAGYPNPFGVAKVLLGDRAVAVGTARVVEQASVSDTTTPGTLIEVDDDASLVVATRDGAVRLSSLRCLAGVDIDLSVLNSWNIEAGLRLTECGDSVSEVHKSVVRSEPKWAAMLGRMAAAELPAAVKGGGAEGVATVELELADPCEPSDIARAFAAFIARVGGGARCHIGLRTLDIDAAAERGQGLFVCRVPLEIDVDPHTNVGPALDTLTAAISESNARGPFLRDLFLRDPKLAGLQRDEEGPIFPVELVLGSDSTGVPAGVSLQALVPTAPTTTLRWRFDSARVDGDAIAALQRQFATYLGGLRDPSRRIGSVSIVDDADKSLLLDTWNNTEREWQSDVTVHQLFEGCVDAHPDAPALSFRGATLSYAEVDARANRLARHLRQNGVRPDGLVGIYMERSNEMVIAALAIMKAGGAYVPLDPDYPAERVAYMIGDSQVAAIITQERVKSRLPATDATIVSIDGDDAAIAKQPAERVGQTSHAENLAYVIYTSGSTGNPKGVMVEHRNVVNFFVGMDERIGTDPGVWLAVTSLNFDISVLELFWTLTRGFHVVVHADDHSDTAFVPANPDRKIDFGAFYFSSDESEGLVDKYQLLIEGAKFADRNGFNAVWTPERHFHAFGGLFPNPSVTSAALATITENVDLRAGSCVTPLHSIIRVAEEWSVVDNLSRGRIGISVAAGWQPNDFVIRPGAFETRRDKMFEDIETLRAFWRGESRTFTNPQGKEVDVRILPRPYSDDIPIWVTAAGNPATFKRAGEVGANLLTHLLGQSIEELAEKIAIYRAAFATSGRPGRGVVSLMLHSFVGESNDASREIVREPMKAYLKSAVGLVKEAAWSFPTFKKTTTMEDGSFGIDHLSEDDMDALLNYAFERYYDTAGLFGDVEHCVQIVDRIKGADVDEIPALIDFGIPTPTVLEALPRLGEVLRRSNEFVDASVEAATAQDFSVAALVARHGVTHFQCTPSQMTMLLVDDDVRTALGGLDRVLVGGEALSAPLANQLAELVEGDVLNMYGPTETTIWSSVSSITGGHETVSIGTPIANTQILILDAHGQLLPPGSIGELCIGGAGVVRGYLHRPDLTAERFIADEHTGAAAGKARLYRTGDLARFMPDGTLAFHGRLDHQVKLRGYRIELGEVEARLMEHDSVRGAAVIIREDTRGDKRMIAYVTPATTNPPAADALRTHLAATLPDYMLPAGFVVLDRFPQTPNRKIDRKALPAPGNQASAGAEGFVAPSNELEEQIAELWRDVLGVPRVGMQDNFFDIGGHSLLTIQVHGRLKALVDRPLSLVDLFRFPTVSSLAKFIGGESDDAKALEQTKERAAGRREAMAKRRGARARRR